MNRRHGRDSKFIEQEGSFETLLKTYTCNGANHFMLQNRTLAHSIYKWLILCSVIVFAFFVLNLHWIFLSLLVALFLLQSFDFLLINSTWHAMWTGPTESLPIREIRAKIDNKCLFCMVDVVFPPLNDRLGIKLIRIATMHISINTEFNHRLSRASTNSK